MSQDTINRLLCVLCWIPESIWMYMLLKLMLPLNPNARVRHRWAFVWFSTHIIFPFIHFFVQIPAVTIAQNFLTVVSFVAVALGAFSGPLFHRLFSMTLLVVAPIVADLLTSVVFYLLKDFAPSVNLYDVMTFDFVKVSGSTAIIGLALQGLACLLWCRTVKKRKVARDMGYMLIFLILGIFILAAGILASSTDSAAYQGAYIYVYMSTLLAVCGGMFVFLNHVEKNTLSKELAETRRLSSLEQVHYADVEARREEMAKIRHDYNNILSSVNFLIQNGSTQEAVQVLSELSTRISGTQEQVFCQVPVVNAVLMEKQQQCAKRSITLEPNLDLPENLPVQGLDLCSAFSNPMDLALEACIMANVSSITLSCKVTHGYLIIKCVVPAGQTLWKPSEDFHRGQQILRDIATRYHGNFFCQRLDGKQTAQLSLMVR